MFQTGKLEREKQEIKMFDIKAYVDKKRESKLNEMMNSFNPMSSTSGFGGGMPNVPRPDVKPKNDSFDIDSLVKRIDAKIAELEEQEKQENAAKLEQNKVTPIDNNPVQTTENKVVNNKKEVEQSNKTETKPISDKLETKPIPEFKQDIKSEPLPEIKLKEEENKVINGVTDDEFFDDFFNDEE